MKAIYYSVQCSECFCILGISKDNLQDKEIYCMKHAKKKFTKLGNTESKIIKHRKIDRKRECICGGKMIFTGKDNGWKCEEKEKEVVKE